MTSNKTNASWWGYYNQYKMLTDKLIEEDRTLLDGLVTLPFLYCLSHTMELGFKASIIDFTGDLADEFKNHKLKQLFYLYREELIKSMEGAQVIEYSKTKILEVVDNLARLIELYGKLSPIHESLKYPINNRGTMLFNYDEGVDNKGVKIDEIIDLYKKTNRLLTWVTSVFCDQYKMDDIEIEDYPEDYM